MKQSSQSVRIHKPKPPQWHGSAAQSFSSAYYEAIQWSGKIPSRKERKFKMSKFMGLDMQQSWPDLLIWEAFFNNYPVKTFIELGTGHGGMALFFALQCKQRNIDFQTFDNVRSFKDDTLTTLVELNAKFHHVDLYLEGHGIIADLIKGPKPVAIFFDDGDKPREWRTFSPLTSPGDFCIVHDWGTEFREADLGGVAVERVMGRVSDNRPDGYFSMWFKRV